MKKLNTFNQKIKLTNSNKVFEPNLTTQSIIEVCNKLKFRQKKKVLDLGSGSGIIGIFLKKKIWKKDRPLPFRLFKTCN